MSEKTVEFRGVDDLYIAEVTEDTKEAYTTGTPELLSDFAEISKTVETQKSKKFYNNKPKIVFRVEGDDAITVAIPVLSLEKLAKITGKTIETTTGAFIDDEPTEKQYALGYRMKKTDGSWRYVWRLKGTFANVPDEAAKTEDDTTDSQGQSIEYAGVYTNHVFAKTSKAAKGVVADDDGKTDVSSWFAAVVTPDTLKAKTT